LVLLWNNLINAAVVVIVIILGETILKTNSELQRDVMAIAEELKVQLPDFNERTDTDIAQSALNALAWNVAVPSEHTK
jgi:hypothetical protein